MIHPFVRVHVVDMHTCKYLAKKDATAPACYNKESVATINSKGVIEKKSTDFIMPVATKLYDMRIKG